MAPRTIYANLADGLSPFSLFDASFADMGSLGIIPCTASGTNAITLTPVAGVNAPNVAVIPQASQLFSFKPAANTTAPVTVKVVSAAGASSFYNLYRVDGTTQTGNGDLVTTTTYLISFVQALNSGTGGYQIIGPPTTSIQSVVNDTNVTGSISGTQLTLGWTGTLAAGRLNSNVVQAVTNDTNIQGSITAQNLTFSWAGTLANARLATMAANTFKGNPTGSSASPTDFTIDGLTLKGSPASTDELIIWDVAGTAIKKATVSGLAAAAGVSSIDTKTGAFTTGNGLDSTAGNIIELTAARRTLPTTQLLTSGTGATYTTPANCLWIEVYMCGGGGGGHGVSSTTNVFVAGSAGGTTTFNSVNANGGGGATGTTVATANAGTGGTGGTGVATRRLPGGPGFGPIYTSSTLGLAGTGAGGGAPFFSAGTAGVGIASANGTSGAANTGAGGGSAVNNASNSQSGGGGGGGEFVYLLITNPAGTYTYTVGTGGGGGSSTNTGGTGGSGVIFVIEHYGT